MQEAHSITKVAIVAFSHRRFSAVSTSTTDIAPIAATPLPPQSFASPTTLTSLNFQHSP
jgi:hypothetical protein